MADRKKVRCPTCNRLVAQILKPGHGGFTTFREGWYEHIANEPIYCRTPQELREACDANAARSAYLQDSEFKTSPGRDHDEFWEARRKEGELIDSGEHPDYVVPDGVRSDD